MLYILKGTTADMFLNINMYMHITDVLYSQAIVQYKEASSEYKLTVQSYRY